MLSPLCSGVRGMSRFLVTLLTKSAAGSRHLDIFQQKMLISLQLIIALFGEDRLPYSDTERDTSLLPPSALDYQCGLSAPHRTPKSAT